MIANVSQPRFSDEKTASIPTRLAILTAESAWGYVMLLWTAALLGSGASMSIAVIAVPYAASVAVSAFLSAWIGAGRSLSSRLCQAGPSGRDVSLPLRMAGRIVSVAFPAAAAVVYCTAGLVVILLTDWWSLLGGPPPLERVALEAGLGTGSADPEVGPVLAWLIILGIAIWVRGTALARGDTALPSPIIRLSWASGLLLVFGLAAPAGMDDSQSLNWVAVFLLAGLLAIMSHRIDLASQESPQSPGWRWGTGVFSAALLLVGLAAGYLGAIWLSGPVHVAWDLLASLVGPLIARFLAWLAGQGQEAVLPLAEPTPMAGAGAGGFFQLPDDVRMVGQWFFNASWIVMILYAVFINLSRWLTRDAGKQSAPSSRENLPWSLREFVVHLLSSLLFLLARRWPAVLRLLRGRTPATSTETMRELYRNLLVWSRRKGLPMVTWMTPREHKTVMASRWPQLEAEFALLTESYLRARYGNARTEDLELEAGIAAFQRIAAETSGTPVARA